VLEIQQVRKWAKRLALFAVAPLTVNAQSASSGDQARGVAVHPHVAWFIIKDQFDVVPDDPYFRKYIVSMYKGLLEHCSPRNSGIGLAAGQYGVPLLKDALSMDIGRMLGAIFAANTAFDADGVRDGSAWGQTLGCNSEDGLLLRKRTEDLIEQRRGRNPEQVNEERIRRLMSAPWARIRRISQTVDYDMFPWGAREVVALERAAQKLDAQRASIEAANRESAAYRSASAEGTTAALYAYLQQYGANAMYRRDVERDLARLDSRAFQTAQTANTHAAFKQYLREFPSGASANLATGRVAFFERQAFTRASSTNTAAAYAEYLRQYPGSADEYAARTAFSRLDRDAFSAALKARSETSFRRYISLIPGGVYTNQAEEWLSANANAARLRSEINKASSEITAARAKTVSRGAVTGVALAATAGFGWVTLTNITVVDSLERELRGLGADDPQRAPMTADRTAALRNTAIYGVGATAAFVIAVKVWNGARGSRLASAAANERKKELETNLKATEQRQRQIEATRVSLAPYRGRGGNGLQVSWSF
jgi:hypothetical protein